MLEEVTQKTIALVFKSFERVARKYNVYNVPKSVDTLRRRDFQKVNCR